MKTNSIGVLLIAGLVVLSAMVVFAGTAAGGGDGRQGGEYISIYGTIRDASGEPIGDGHTVEILKYYNEQWHLMNGIHNTNDAGEYDTGWVDLSSLGDRNCRYQMKLDGDTVDTRDIANWICNDGGCCDDCFCCCKNWSHRWDYQIPTSRASRYQ